MSNSLAAMLDIGVTHLLQGALKFARSALLVVTGVAALLFTYEELFSHDEGILDLSRLEWAFLAAFVLLERRLSHYHGHFGYGYIRSVIAMLHAIGVSAVLWLLVSGVYAMAAVFDHALLMELQQPTSADAWFQVAWLGSLLAASYLAAPTRTIAELSAPLATSASGANPEPAQDATKEQQ